MIVLAPEPPSIDADLLAAFARVSPSTIGHMTDTGFMKGLRALVPGKLVGRAFTVKIPHLDSSAVHVAVSLMGAGDVLVVDMSGDFDRACVGGIVAYAARRRGAAGIVVDGSITDVDEVRSLGMPVYHRGFSPLTTRNLGIEGAIHTPVSVAGAVVLPGDLILGDDSGVMVVRSDDMRSLAELAYTKERGEAETRRKLDAGALLMQLSGAEKYLRR